MLADDDSNHETTHEFEESDSRITRSGIRSKRMKMYVITSFITGAVVFFLVGFLVGYFGTGSSRNKLCSSEHSSAEELNVNNFANFHELFHESVSKEKLEAVLREFSTQPHIAGSRRQRELAQNLSSRWKAFGFDKVEMPEYKVLLSFPQPKKPNKVSVIENGAVEYEITGKIKMTTGPNNKAVFDHYPYLAYAPNGTVEGQLVYANYGQDEDFKELAEMNIDVKGKIVIIRSRNVNNAEKHGAIGALVYPDPEFAAQQGYDVNQVYPEDWWLPPSGVQEGSILFGPYLGDPLTPVLPATEGMYRRPYSDAELPRIPAQAISYGQADGLLRRLGGPEVPDSWKGGLNITYRLGPGFHNTNAILRLEVNNQLESKTILNVIGTIYGREEPDRYVLVGNHRDSWSFGAADALSGTTVMNEMARVLGVLLENGWRPRRTIKVCSWGGEEFNLIGSHEWVEENANILAERAVAYINMDMAVSGNYVLRARASPLFKQVTYKWAKKVKDPNAPDGTDTVFDVWLKRTPSDTNSKEPLINNLFTSSDYASFYQYLGIPCGDYGYWFGFGDSSSLYPVYHTQQDTFYWMKQFVDQEFEIHKAMARFGGGMLLDFADLPLLPLDIINYASTLNNSYHILASSPKFQENNISLLPLQEAILKFVKASWEFERRKSEPTLLKSAYKLRMYNDQIVRVENAFIHPYGLPGKPQDRHVAFNFGFHNIESTKATFPGVTEAVHQAETSGDWAEVRRQLSVAEYSVDCATRVLEPLDPEIPA